METLDRSIRMVRLGSMVAIVFLILFRYLGYLPPSFLFTAFIFLVGINLILTGISHWRAESKKESLFVSAVGLSVFIYLIFVVFN